jgi:A/G-specific adenine glycosylase
MLQQTTVATVRKRYDTFLRRFPDVSSLARASEEEILAAWSGLGYYARARNLRLAAQSIVRNHGGAIPRAPSVLKRLPGFGEYMAAAVASLAYGARLPAVEANVERVIARLFALSGVAGSPRLRRSVTSWLEELLPARRAGDLTAAFMDLGQTICTPRRPACPVCPVAPICEARRCGRPEAFPRRRSKPTPLRLPFAAAVAEWSGRVLLVRRKSTWLDGLWEFPSAEGASADEARRALARRIADLGLRLAPTRAVATARHAVVNRRLEIAVFRARRSGRSRPAGKDARWFLPQELGAAAVPTLTRKIAAAGSKMGSGRYLGISTER